MAEKLGGQNGAGQHRSSKYFRFIGFLSGATVSPLRDVLIAEEDEIEMSRIREHCDQVHVALSPGYTLLELIFVKSCYCSHYDVSGVNICHSYMYTYSNATYTCTPLSLE